jgi:hypothetical protein
MLCIVVRQQLILKTGSVFLFFSVQRSLYCLIHYNKSDQVASMKETAVLQNVAYKIASGVLKFYGSVWLKLTSQCLINEVLRHEDG